MQQEIERRHRGLPSLVRRPAARPRATAGSELGAVAEEVAGHVVDPQATWRWKRGDTVRVAVAGITVLLGGIVASRGVPSWESATFLKINGLPDGLYPVLWPLMQLGNVWVASAVGLVAAGLVRRPWPSLVLALTAPVAWFAAKVVKAAVDRGRPAGEGLEVIQRGAAETGLGYISGHSTVAFALAAAVAAHLRRPWGAVLLILAGLVGIARIYVGVHLPLDVVGGAACGLLIGEAARVVELIRGRGERLAGLPVTGATASKR